ncbi:hypothetical protein BBJ28_00009821 [Nothophytophthora sp. Chile5]|nr:hypothetical protein BBJ28_00009821 [Nothophytophthora sp. Chile5]
MLARVREDKDRGLTRKKFCLAASVLLAVAAVITIVVVLTQQSGDGDGNATTSVDSLTLPRMAVANLTLVGGFTVDSAKEQCLTLGWIPTGVNWETSSSIRASYLCMQQSLPVGEDEVEAVDLDGTSVLRRLAVLPDAESCPSNMTQLANPRANVLVCVDFISASEAFSTQQYAMDLMTTSEAFYSHDTPGWVTWPVDLKLDDTDETSVFLSVRYPVRPITALQVLSDVASDTVYAACEDLEPIGAWESPEFVLRSESESVTTTNDIVCIRRLQAGDVSTSVLLDTTVILPSETCPVLAGNATSTEITSDRIKVCAEWGVIPSNNSSNPSNAPFVVELAQYHTIEAITDTNASTAIPGNWSLIGDTPTGDIHKYFLVRKSMISNSSGDETGVGEIEDGTVTSTVEATRNQTALSFRVLQIADLHLTGDPDYPCSSGPTGAIRASILEAASVIARELKQANGSSNSTSASDPLYNRCREALTIAFLDELLDVEQPDFVVFSGDNVHTSDATNHSLAIGTFTDRVESRGIPWAAVFGNHDTEGGFDREEMLELMTSNRQFAHVKYGPRGIDGVGNYEVEVVAPVAGAWGSEGSTVFRMYFLDSHANIDAQRFPLVADPSSYDWVKETQIDFYRELARSHAAEASETSNATNSSIPAVMFFHIPLAEYALASSSDRIGEKHEATASAEVNCGLFSALVELGDVKATFVGHDHVNEYCYLRQGVQLCYGGGIGLGRAYGLRNFDRRARVIEWSLDSEQKHTIRSWKRHFQDPTQIQSLEVLYSE